MTTYQLGIVGESHYQPAIRRCSAGDSVEIVHERDNPYDEGALAVVSLGGETIGYVPRACWLQDAIHEEGKGCDATIRSIRAGGEGLLGVVLDVTLNMRGVAERAFDRIHASQENPSRQSGNGWLGRIFGL